jgi:hypothetical protein
MEEGSEELVGNPLGRLMKSSSMLPEGLKKSRFFFCERVESAPVGIRTRVEASKGLHDWPLHHRSVFLLSSPNMIQDSIAGSKD